MSHLLPSRKSFLKSIALLVMLAGVSFCTSAQTNWNFAAPTDGSGNAGAETGKGICTDASGNVYVAGVFSGTSDFDLSVGTSTATATSNDGYIVSYDKNGVFRWKTIVTGSGSDFALYQTGICTDGTNVWVAGSISVGTAVPHNPSIISSSNTITITSTATGTGVEAMVAKLNCSNGATQWVKAFGGTTSSLGDAAQGIAIDPNGCVYVIGCYSGAFSLNGITAPATSGSTDMFLAKFATDGIMIHFAKGGTSSADMQVTGSGICYVPGATPAIVAVGSQNWGSATYGSFTLSNSAGGASHDAVLLELDTAFNNFTNAILIGSSEALTDELISATYDPFSGGVYICGYFTSTSISLPGAGMLTSTGSSDWMIARYSPSANNFVWGRSAGGSGADRAFAVTADGQGGILVSGSTASASATFGSVTLTAPGSVNDMVVARYSTGGTVAWAINAGGVGGDDARSVASYVQSTPYTQSLYITGNFQNTVNFNGTNLTADGGNDFFLARINDATLPLIATQSQTNLTCNGVATGSATVVASGGISPYTYSWSPSGGTGATASSLVATTYTCTITDASSNSITKTFTITQPPVITSSLVMITNVACNGGSNGAATIMASGGTGTLSYNWTPGNPSGDGTTSVTGLSAGTYTCTITDANGCTGTRNATISQPTAILSTVSVNNASCEGRNNGSATITAIGGQPSYTYNWTPGNPSGNGTVSVSGLAPGSYTCVITDANSCTKSQAVTIATSSGSQTGGLAGVAGGGASSETHNVSGESGYYMDGSCNRIGRVQASGVNPVSGNVTSKVWIETAVLSHGGSFFVARHYEITSAISPGTSTGTVTLYFLQSEFDAYNTAAGSAPKLPANSSDATGIANMRVKKYTGSSSDNSGLPATYSSGSVIINPDDADIVWNATASRWEITFAVDGFSGFFIQSASSTLPVTWASFTAEKQGEKVLLKWQTASEINSSHFVIEYSHDGRQFTSLGNMSASGNSNTLSTYNFLHSTPHADNNFYRILQVDQDGRHEYSDVRKVIMSRNNDFTILVNPVINGKLQVQSSKPAMAVMYNAAGQAMWKQTIMAGSQSIDVNQLAQGIYLLQVGNETKTFMIR